VDPDALRSESVDDLEGRNCCECRGFVVVTAQVKAVEEGERPTEPSDGIERLRAVALFNRVEKVAENSEFVQCSDAEVW